MNLKNQQIIEDAMAKIEEIQMHIANIEAAKVCIRKRSPRFFVKEIDVENIIEILYREELGEWRNLFMFGLTVQKTQQDRIKAASYQRFLNDTMDVSQWLGRGPAPTSWLSADEVEFRKMVKAAFSPEELKQDGGSVNITLPKGKK